VGVTPTRPGVPAGTAAAVDVVAGWLSTPGRKCCA